MQACLKYTHSQHGGCFKKWHILNIKLIPTIQQSGTIISWWIEPPCGFVYISILWIYIYLFIIYYINILAWPSIPTIPIPNLGVPRSISVASSRGVWAFAGQSNQISSIFGRLWWKSGITCRMQLTSGKFFWLHYGDIQQHCCPSHLWWQIAIEKVYQKYRWCDITHVWETANIHVMHDMNDQHSGTA